MLGSTVTLVSVNGVTVGIGTTWQANLYTFDDLSNAYYSDQSGYLDKYRKAAWLSAILLGTTDPTAMAGLQHAIWILFVPSAPDAGAAPWLSAANTAQQAGFDGLDFAGFRVINSPPGAPRVQEFIANGFPPATVPEPATFFMLGTALVLLGGATRRVLRTKPSES